MQFIWTKHNMQILGAIRFIELKKQKTKTLNNS